MINELELKRYHYWDDYEDDNVKRFHFFEDNKGNKEVHIDFSPYYYPTEAELDAVRRFVDVTGRIPDRMDNSNFNFRKGDIFKILERICPCGEIDCAEAYSHTTSGY